MLATITNPILKRAITRGKAELRRTVGHRRGIILGYIKVNLDSLQNDGLITDTERRIACSELDIFYNHIDV